MEQVTKREIKFRAWDGEQMFYPENHTHISIFQGKGRIPWGLYANMGGSRITDGQYGGALLQFTGLLDKNGKEIYEGDIVRCNNDDVGAVEWEDHDACWNIDGYFNPDNDYPTMAFHEGQPFEVLGNIYENGELLNKEPAQKV